LFASDAAALAFGESAPDAELFGDGEGVSQAFGADRAAPAHGLSGFGGCGFAAPREEQVRVDAGARSSSRASSWWGWVYLVTFGSLLAFTAFVWVAGHAPVSLVATYAFVNPVVAVLLGWWFRGESLTFGLLVGAAVVVVGVALVVSAEWLARRGEAEGTLLTGPSQAEH